MLTKTFFLSRKIQSVVGWYNLPLQSHSEASRYAPPPRRRDGINLGFSFQPYTQPDGIGNRLCNLFLMMEALVDAAMEEGLTESTARKLCLQTGLGAARLASDSEQSLQRLRLNVTSPGGTTEQGVRALEENHFRGALRSAIKAAKSRSIKLEQELGQ